MIYASKRMVHAPLAMVFLIGRLIFLLQHPKLTQIKVWPKIKRKTIFFLLVVNKALLCLMLITL